MNRTPPPATTPSFEKSAKPLLLTLKPSWVWFLFLLGLHLLAILAVLIAAIPVAVKLLMLVLIPVSFVLQTRQQQQKTQLVWRTGNRWFINDEQSAYALHAVDFFSRWLVILSVLTESPDNSGMRRYFGRKRKFIIPFDALDKDTFRLLRVRLRIEGHDLLNPPAETIK